MKKWASYNVTGEGLLVALFILAFLTLFLGALVLMEADARAFARECLAGGGYVASPKVCVR